jgi:hypothetical protein
MNQKIDSLGEFLDYISVKKYKCHFSDLYDYQKETIRGSFFIENRQKLEKWLGEW